MSILDEPRFTPPQSVPVSDTPSKLTRWLADMTDLHDVKSTSTVPFTFSSSVTSTPAAQSELDRSQRANVLETAEKKLRGVRQSHNFFDSSIREMGSAASSTSTGLNSNRFLNSIHSVQRPPSKRGPSQSSRPQSGSGRRSLSASPQTQAAGRSVVPAAKEGCLSAESESTVVSRIPKVIRIIVAVALIFSFHLLVMMILLQALTTRTAVHWWSRFRTFHPLSS